MPQQGFAYAPVVQAPAGASEGTIGRLFGELVGNAGTEIGRGVVQAIFGAS